MSDPTEGAAPPRSVLENSWVQFVHAASVQVGDERVVVVGRCQTRGDVCQDVSVQVVRQCRVEVALVRQLRTELQRTQQASIVLGVTPTWLTKSLLQPKRRFRAPLLFGHVLELHLAARGRDVVLVGGMPLPEPLATVMNARIDELAREAASKSVSDPSPEAMGETVAST